MRKVRNATINIAAVAALFAGAAAALIALLVVLAFPAMIIFGTYAGYHGWHTPGFFETLFGLLSLSILGNTFFPSNLRGRK